MKRLKATILSQTSALITKDSKAIDDSLLTYKDKLKNAPADIENRADVKDNVMCRWKFAFKDLSLANNPTMVRTRQGILHYIVYVIY